MLHFLVLLPMWQQKWATTKMVHFVYVAHLIYAGRESKHHLPHLVRAATREEGGIHPSPSESQHTRAPPPQAPLLPCTAASGLEAEQSRVAGAERPGVARGGGRASDPLPKRARMDWSMHTPIVFPAAASSMTAAPAAPAAIAIGWSPFQVFCWRSTILGSASHKLRCSIWLNTSLIWSTSVGDNLRCTRQLPFHRWVGGKGLRPFAIFLKK
jgi:hypothetical protein